MSNGSSNFYFIFLAFFSIFYSTKIVFFRMKSYLDSLSGGSLPWNIRKIILLGKEGVGKTTLSRSLGKKNGKIDCTKK